MTVTMMIWWTLAAVTGAAAEGVLAVQFSKSELYAWKGGGVRHVLTLLFSLALLRWANTSFAEGFAGGSLGAASFHFGTHACSFALKRALAKNGR